MRITIFKITLPTLAFASLLLSNHVQAQAPEFQRSFGNSSDNSFSKVIRSGSNYYVLGQSGVATVTYLDAYGQQLWTLGVNVASVWNDAVLTPAGDLLVVGSTLPYNDANKSLMGLISAATGNFTWVRSYNVAGREGFTRIVRSPSPQNAAFPYYVLGVQHQASGNATWDDATLLNVDANGNFSWKKIFNSTADDEFVRDLEVLPNGDLLLAGADLSLGGNNARGKIIRTNNVGVALGGLQTPIALSFSDLTRETAGGDGFFAVGTGFPNGAAYLMKYDAELSSLWDASIAGLTMVSQVWQEPSSGSIYVIGTGVFSGKSRAVLMRFIDFGTEPALEWVRYLDNGETSYSAGSAWFLPPGQIAFVDGRTPSSDGFGQLCAFMSISNLELATCMTQEESLSVLNFSFLYDSPVLPPIDFANMPPGADLLVFGLDWQQQDVCSVPCVASFTVTPLTNCGGIAVHGTSTGPQPITYTWCDGQIGSDLHLQLPCGPNTFCVTVTCADGSTSSATQTITVTDNVPPVALCALGVGVGLDANCSYIVTPAMIDAGSTDNCQIQSITVSPTLLTGCGVSTITMTVTDWCGNKSLCTTGIQTGEGVPPLMTCPANITVNGEQVSDQLCAGLVQIVSPITLDNCSGPIKLTNDYTNGNDANGAYPSGTTTVTWTATDGCENVTTCTMTVTVMNCAPIPEDPCCAYALHLYNAYADQRIKKVRVSGLCGTEICCADPDFWAVNDNHPYYVEFFPEDGSGFPLGSDGLTFPPDPLDVIENDFEIWLKKGSQLHNLQVDWYDFLDNVVCTHNIEIDCNGMFSNADDYDWTQFTSITAHNDPKLFVFVVREPDDDTESVCNEDERQTEECEIDHETTCCEPDYCVTLTPPSAYTNTASYTCTWSVKKGDDAGPMLTAGPDGSASFKVPNDGSASGTYTVALTVYSKPNSTTASATLQCTGEKDIVILPKITPEFTWKLLPCGLEVEFNFKSKDDWKGLVDDITWTCSPAQTNFPGSTGSSNVSGSFTYTFPAEAKYTITMEIKDSDGCFHKTKIEVNNYRGCVPSFEVEYDFCAADCGDLNNIYISKPVTFKNTSSGGGCPVDYEWTFGDGTNGNDVSSSFTHDYVDFINCPGGTKITVTLTMNDMKSVSPQIKRCSSGISIKKDIAITPCLADFTYEACADRTVVFESNMPGKWDVQGDGTIVEEESDEADVNGIRKKKLKVLYASDGSKSMKFTGYCENGGRCEKTISRIGVNYICCRKYSTQRDAHRFKGPAPDEIKFKMKYKLVQNQFLTHNVKAVTRLKKRSSSNSKFWYWQNTYRTLKTSLEGNVWTKSDNCKCKIIKPVSASNGPHSNQTRVKAKDNHLGKYRSRLNSITSTHTVTVGTLAPITKNLSVGKDCHH